MSEEINIHNIPKHIAFIMDGNGRWAKKRGLPRSKGHEEGSKAIKRVTLACKNLGVKVITLFAFSTENWKRPKEEVDFIFSLLEKLLKKNRKWFKKDNIKVSFIGDIEELDERFYDVIKKTMELTSNNDGIVLNIALNYGGKNEIIKMVKEIGEDVKLNKLEIASINEEIIERYLMTREFPKVDLLVRSSGEYRISNFLLWQIAYSEMIFTPIYWPDFDEEVVKDLIIEYQCRDRRFGGVKS